MAMQIRLVASGYCVEMASGMQQAIEIVSQTSLFAAIVDVNLPDGNGIDLMDRVHQIRSAALPVIIMTASKKPGLRESALKQGAVQFYEKPFHSNELIKTLQSLPDNSGDACSIVS